MYAEFIYRPLSGQFPEKHFGEVTPHVSWVKFMDNDYQEWVGSFAQGWEGYVTCIVNLEENDLAFIVTGGFGYLIDIRKRELLNQTAISDIKTALADLDRRRVIFSEGIGLKCIDFAGNVTTLLNQPFFDEIELLNIKDHRLYAHYWYYQRVGNPFCFEMNLQTNEYYNSLNEQVNQNQIAKGTKPSVIEKLKKWFRD
jgi:hypothetical protein